MLHRKLDHFSNFDYLVPKPPNILVAYCRKISFSWFCNLIANLDTRIQINNCSLHTWYYLSNNEVNTSLHHVDSHNISPRYYSSVEELREIFLSPGYSKRLSRCKRYGFGRFCILLSHYHFVIDANACIISDMAVNSNDTSPCITRYSRPQKRERFSFSFYLY